MLLVKKLTIGELSTNCYLVYDSSSKEGIIIDPADDAEYIERIILSENITPLKIIATHGHFDHILASLELKLAFNIPFCVNKLDEFLLKRSVQTAKYFTNQPNPLMTVVDEDLGSQNEVSIGENVLKILKTPGHTPGGISLYSKADKIAFVGDMITSEGYGSTNHTYSNKNNFKKSLALLRKLPSGTLFYAGHGEAFFNACNN